MLFPRVLWCNQGYCLLFPGILCVVSRGVVRCFQESVLLLPGVLCVFSRDGRDSWWSHPWSSCFASEPCLTPSPYSRSVHSLSLAYCLWLSSLVCLYMTSSIRNSLMKFKSKSDTFPRALFHLKYRLEESFPFTVLYSGI